jgi:hypothetical protein
MTRRLLQPIGVTNMPAVSLSPFKSIDKYFLICKIVTLLFCLPWPLTLLASLMSLAGQFQPDTAMFIRVLVRLGWLLILVYPLVFFAIVFFAERVLARRSYAAAAVVALLPIAFSLFAVVKLFVI